MSDRSGDEVSGRAGKEVVATREVVAGDGGSGRAGEEGVGGAGEEGSGCAGE